MAKENKKIVLESLSKRVTKDNFELGQNPDESQDILLENNLGSFDNADDLISFLNKTYGLSKDKDNYSAFEDGRITYQQLEDGDGNVVEAKDAIYKKFKKGEVDLWAADYDIFIELAEVKTPSVKEIAKLFGIKEYAKGGKLERFFGKAKDYSKRAVEGVKKSYGQAKYYTNKKIHDKKKEIAWEVLQETRNLTPDNKVGQRQSQIVNEASNLVEEFYEKGGAIRTSNTDSGSYVNSRQDFKANNLEGKNLSNGVYVVLSYGYYPIYLWKKNKWYGNKSKYSSSTAKQMYYTKPSDVVEYVDTDKLKKLAGTEYFEEGGSLYEVGGNIGYKRFKGGVKVKVSEAYLNDEASGGNATAIATVIGSPKDAEDDVQIQYENGMIDYLNQEWLEPIDEMEHGGLIGKNVKFKYIDEQPGFWGTNETNIQTQGEIVDKVMLNGIENYIIKEDNTGDLLRLETTELNSAYSLKDGVTDGVIVIEKAMRGGKYKHGGSMAKGGKINSTWEWLSEEITFWDLFKNK